LCGTSAWWWKYGVPVELVNAESPDNKLYFLCRACYVARQVRWKFNVGKGRAGVLYHFKNAHEATYHSESNNLSFTPNTLDLLDTQDPKQKELYNQLAETFDGDALRRDLMSWIVQDNVPFQTVESEHFRKLLNRVHPFMDDDVVPCATTVSRWIKTEFLLHKHEIRSALASAISHIHLSFDLWTNRRRKAINGVTAHFFDSKGRCRTILLALTEMADLHTGKNIALNTLKVIREYGF
jgi:hypothetical protein